MIEQGTFSGRQGKTGTHMGQNETLKILLLFGTATKCKQYKLPNGIADTSITVISMIQTLCVNMRKNVFFLKYLSFWEIAIKQVNERDSLMYDIHSGRAITVVDFQL